MNKRFKSSIKASLIVYGILYLVEGLVSFILWEFDILLSFGVLRFNLVVLVIIFIIDYFMFSGGNE